MVLIGLVSSASIGIATVSGAQRSSPGESAIAGSRVKAAFPEQLEGVVVLANLQMPMPSGDLGEYLFYAAQSWKAFVTQPVRQIPAALTVFPTVSGARQASIRIRNGGYCLAHPDKLSLPWRWATCTHLRIANVLLIMSSDIGAAHRKTLVAALLQLGTPTRS
jgi:hypothetical protein